MGEQQHDQGMRVEPEPPGLTRSVRRSWLLHCRLSVRLDPETLDRWAPRILGNLEQMSGAIRGEPHLTNLERWRSLVSDRDLTGLRRALIGLDEDAIRMREVSPMRGLLPQEERSEALWATPPPRPQGR